MSGLCGALCIYSFSSAAIDAIIEAGNISKPGKVIQPDRVLPVAGIHDFLTKMGMSRHTRTR